jgi:hypothetical protein
VTSFVGPFYREQSLIEKAQAKLGRSIVLVQGSVPVNIPRGPGFRESARQAVREEISKSLSAQRGSTESKQLGEAHSMPDESGSMDRDTDSSVILERELVAAIADGRLSEDDAERVRVALLHQ